MDEAELSAKRWKHKVFHGDVFHLFTCPTWQILSPEEITQEEQDEYAGENLGDSQAS
jgi:hypothetical protein